MDKAHERCPYRLVHEVQIEQFGEDVTELKDRVGGLEKTLARGVLLLVANLTGMVVSLAEQVLRS